jgi:hypothetical protein
MDTYRVGVARFIYLWLVKYSGPDRIIYMAIRCYFGSILFPTVLVDLAFQIRHHEAEGLWEQLKQSTRLQNSMHFSTAQNLLLRY